MDNKLSELSKPVAYDYQIAGACIADGHNKNGQWVHWRNELSLECPPDWMIEGGKVKDLKPRYSQEYVSALLAELEAAEQRIAELEATQMTGPLALMLERLAELERELNVAANREAQQVVEADYIRYDCGCCGFETLEEWRDNDVCPKCNHKPLHKTELYTAPPAPAVPAVPTNAQPIGVVSGWEKITREPMRYKFESSKSKAELMGAAIYLEPPAQAIPQAMTRDNVPFRYTAPQRWDAYTDGYNACRAAMLAQPVSKGYKLPDGWIACSERMPDNDETKPIVIYTGKCLGQGMFVATYDEDGFFDYWEGGEIIGVTHWMPLPAAPEGGNG